MAGLRTLLRSPGAARRRSSPARAGARARRPMLRSSSAAARRSTMRCSTSGSSNAHTDWALRTSGSRSSSGRRQNASKNPSAQSPGVGMRSTRVRPPRAAATSSIAGNRGSSFATPSRRYSSCHAGRWSSSNVNTTTGPRATRRSSARPASGDCQWWIVTHAIAASNAPSSNGSASARASIAGAAPAGRWARIVALGSTASTQRSPGS